MTTRVMDPTMQGEPNKQTGMGVTLWAMCLFGAAFTASSSAAAPAPVETLVFIRHGEKPQAGLGQLACQGLNRALALPAVIGRKFGRPDAFFAPDPAVTKQDNGQDYDYVRPLATIEPAAIAFGRAIDASVGVRDIGVLASKLHAPDLQAALVVIAWEHTEIVALVRALMKQHGGNPALVPDWSRADFDSIYVVKLSPGSAATFARDSEGLNGLSTRCPS